MPNLERTAVTTWLTELRPDMASVEWPTAVRPVEEVQAVAAQLSTLGETFDRLAQEDLQVLAQALRENPLRDDLTAVLAQLGAARVLRVMHWLAETGMPDVHNVMGALMQANSRPARTLRATIDAVTHRALVRRMFAPERITAVEAACETLKEIA